MLDCRMIRMINFDRFETNFDQVLCSCIIYQWLVVNGISISISRLVLLTTFTVRDDLHDSYVKEDQKSLTISSIFFSLAITGQFMTIHQEYDSIPKKHCPERYWQTFLENLFSSFKKFSCTLIDSIHSIHKINLPNLFLHEFLYLPSGK
jgi:hypothetical protein